MKTATTFNDMLDALDKSGCKFTQSSEWGAIGWGSLSYSTFSRKSAAIALSSNAIPYWRADRGDVFSTYDGEPGTLVFVTACAVLGHFSDARELVAVLCDHADELGITLVCEAVCVKELAGREWFPDNKKLRAALVTLGFTAEPGSPVYTRKPTK